jgi:MFS transporter, DHA2 family, multidrug resistance protein
VVLVGRRVDWRQVTFVGDNGPMRPVPDGPARPHASVSASAAPPREGDIPPVGRWLVAGAVLASAIMELVDTSAVNVSLPYIAGNLSASINESTWVLTSYLVSNAIVLPTAGWLANYVGRKRLLMMAVATFTVSSVLCGLAPSLPMLVFFRILQGLGGGCLQPTSRAILLETFPAEERGKAMALWGIGIVVAPIVAPVLGGWLTTSYTWRLIFFINVPISAVGLVMVRLFVHDPPYIRRGSNRIDYWGLAMMAIGIAALQLMLDKGQEDDWFSSHFIVTLAIVAIVGLTAFVVWELRSPDPIVRFRLLRHRTFAAGVALSAVLGVVLFGTIVLMPLFMQELLGFPAVTAGLWNSPRGLITMAGMPLAGVLISRRWDTRRLLFAGALATALGTWLLSYLNLNAGPWDFLWPQLVIGAGLSFTFVPLATITVDPIPAPEMGYATSIIALMRNIGGGIGISAVTTLLARRTEFHRAMLAANVGPYDPQAAQMLAHLQAALTRAGASAAGARDQSVALLAGLVHRQALVMSYLDGFRALALLMLLAAPLVWIMQRRATDRRHPAPAPRPAPASSSS